MGRCLPARTKRWMKSGTVARSREKYRLWCEARERVFRIARMPMRAKSTNKKRTGLLGWKFGAYELTPFFFFRCLLYASKHPCRDMKTKLSWIFDLCDFLSAPSLYRYVDLRVLSDLYFMTYPFSCSIALWAGMEGGSGFSLWSCSPFLNRDDDNNADIIYFTTSPFIPGIISLSLFRKGSVPMTIHAGNFRLPNNCKSEKTL